MKQNDHSTEQGLKVAFCANKFAERRAESSVFEHSLEFVARINQVNFINDSKATSVHETFQSLNLMTESIVLILGGTDRKSDYTVLGNLVAEKVKTVICMGTEREPIFSAFMNACLVIHAYSLQEALQLAVVAAKPGYAVLFSPGCPSSDAFDNYKIRGEKFKQIVQTL
jgi:UDP-N-acetylmuramoylalanine--D-glutamate ligase